MKRFNLESATVSRFSTWKWCLLPVFLFACGAFQPVHAQSSIRNQLEPYDFMAIKPPRHHIGANLGIPQMLNIHYEYAPALDRFGHSASLLGVDFTIAPLGGGVSYRQRIPETSFFIMLGYAYLSIPRGFVDAEVDLGWRVRSAQLWNFAGGIWNWAGSSSLAWEPTSR